jgi:hypothetical protein
VVERQSVLEVANRALDLVQAPQPELGTGRGRHPAHDQAVGLFLAEGPVGDLGHVGGAVQPVGDGPPVRLGDGVDQLVVAFCSRTEIEKRAPWAWQALTTFSE